MCPGYAGIPGLRRSLSPTRSRKRERGLIGVGGEDRRNPVEADSSAKIPAPIPSVGRITAFAVMRRSPARERRITPSGLFALQGRHLCCAVREQGLGVPLDPTRSISRETSAHAGLPLTEGRAKPTQRRLRDMDVAKAPMGYRDVPSGRASGCVGMCEGSPAPPDPYVGASALVTFWRLRK